MYIEQWRSPDQPTFSMLQLVWFCTCSSFARLPSQCIKSRLFIDLACHWSFLLQLVLLFKCFAVPMYVIILIGKAAILIVKLLSVQMILFQLVHKAWFPYRLLAHTLQKGCLNDLTRTWSYFSVISIIGLMVSLMMKQGTLSLKDALIGLEKGISFGQKWKLVMSSKECVKQSLHFLPHTSSKGTKLV